MDFEKKRRLLVSLCHMGRELDNIMLEMAEWCTQDVADNWEFLFCDAVRYFLFFCWMLFIVLLSSAESPHATWHVYSCFVTCLSTKKDMKFYSSEISRVHVDIACISHKLLKYAAMHVNILI